ncbi:MAG: hypothetical protein AAGF07_02935 [Patescibacteria group bacterium]
MKNNLGGGLSAIIPKKTDKLTNVNIPTSQHVNMFTSQNDEIRQTEKRFTTYLPPEIIKQLKSRCVQDDIVIKDFVREAIKKKLEGN